MIPALVCPRYESLPRRSPTRTAGFTLIELIAVIVMIAILGSVAAATMDLSSARSGLAAKQLLRDMTFARQWAIATGTNSWVVVSTGSNVWSVLAEDPANPGRVNATAMTDMATGKQYTTTLGVNDYVGVSVTGCNFDGGTEVGFDWLGRPIVSGGPLVAQGTITLTGGRQIVVEAGSGHIRYTP
jgi:prepilin-type N-terminal cleavage/methylation domain-containing protein